MNGLLMLDSLSVLSGKMELYKMISIGFHYPDLSIYNDIKNQKFLLAFENAWYNVTNDEKKFSDKSLLNILSLKDISFEDFESNYITDFEATVPGSGCSLYERHYLINEKFNTLLLELKAFYKNFELNKSPEFNESEDHIVFELEFMHFLIFKELQAIEEGIDKKPYQNCRYDFLARHLTKWIPELANKSSNQLKSEFHSNLIRLLKDLVDSDFNDLKLELEAT